ncbi:MAG: IclR family transcriptional regulator [Alphaproteobacteria bacterium]|jgi:DNA-binding IclR family transcriptional regulator|nr:IclR family transcriptional regulator [Alphaproteobacteria bacterium]MDP6515437.1 IclR family transcriptional regulator [Alphaproteobacteria bacterium]
MKTSVKSADRALDVFEAFSLRQRPLSLTQIAEAIGAPASSCHGLIRTLESRGYLCSAGRRLLYPTRRLYEVARAILAHDPVLERAEPELARLRDATRETVILGKRQDDGVVYLAVHEGLHTIRYSAGPGEVKPLHSSAIGKAMLGSLPEAELDGVLRHLELPRVTENTLTTVTRLAGDIAIGRERGYFVTRGENVADVMAVATSLVLNDEPYGIAIAGPIQRMEPMLTEYGERLGQTRRALAAAIPS